MIRRKMAEFGTYNMGAFVRKMVIDGYIVKLDMPELKEILRLLSITSNNANQMARRLNASESIYKEDLDGINTKLDEIYKLLRKLILKLSKIH